MMLFAVLYNIVLFITIGNALTTSKLHLLKESIKSRSFQTRVVKEAPVDYIMPFLSEHIQPSDQLLFVGASTDMVVKLSSLGYGTHKTGRILCVDMNEENIKECSRIAATNPITAQHMTDGKLQFQVADLSNMPQICKQSTFDAIVDYGGIDSLHREGKGRDAILQCIDHLQNAVRLGNILVCLSELERQEFCSPFDERFGWVNELDGDPGAISAWYRGKTNIEATKSEFQRLGLKMYVYTNTDNC